MFQCIVETFKTGSPPKRVWRKTYKGSPRTRGLSFLPESMENRLEEGIIQKRVLPFRKSVPPRGDDTQRNSHLPIAYTPKDFTTEKSRLSLKILKNRRK